MSSQSQSISERKDLPAKGVRRAELIRLQQGRSFADRPVGRHKCGGCRGRKLEGQ